MFLKFRLSNILLVGSLSTILSVYMLAIFGENKGHSFISEPKRCQMK